MNKEILAFDIDNTIAQFVEPILELYNQKYNDNIKFEDIVNYDFSYMLKPECSDIFAEFATKEFFDQLKPYDGVFNTIEKLESKYNIIFATAAYPQTHTFRDEWFKRWYKNYKSSQFYSMPCKQLLNGNIWGLCDDGMHNLVGGNYRGFIISQPWNIGYNNRFLRRNNIIRIDSVNDLIDILL